MKERILEKYVKLISDLDLAIRQPGEDWPDDTIVTRVITESLNLIKMTCGSSSDYYLRLKDITTGKNYHSGKAVEYKGVIEAAYNDYRDGFARLDSLVKAEIFDDFLSMAEYLLEEGYYIPAASLAGGVLEDFLRKLCDKNNITYQEKTKINSLNTELVKAQVYNQLEAKEITAKAEIRNNADHGKYNDNEFKTADVTEMVEWIRRFITEYL